MREINAKDITAQVKRLCMEANSYLPEDIKEKINACEQAEPWDLAKNILGIIHENYLIAEKAYVPVWRKQSTKVYVRDTQKAACVNRSSVTHWTGSIPPTTPRL